MEQENNAIWSPADMLEIILNEPDDFLKVRETLTRIGVASRKEQKLFQMQSDSLLDADDLAVSVFGVAGSEDNIIIEGSLIKRNWYNKLQLRHF